ncbi:MAG TPA: GNAT family protein [Vicinamibacterales bacterium]|nr:GNAT family protein [Vicinamibacterales bacterium]
MADGRSRTLRGSSVALAPLVDADLPRLFAWINDREEVLTNAAYRPVSETDHRAWFESIRQRSDVVIFGIRTLVTDALVGSCQLHSMHPVHRIAELQIRLGEKDARGKGWGSEAVRLLLDFAFRDLNLERVFVQVFATNVAAIRVYEKTGFSREGVLRKAAHIDGERVDVVMMGILREEHAGI